MIINLRAKSSNDVDFYKIVVICEKNTLKISCDCPAGAIGKTMCKHRSAILENKPAKIYDTDSSDFLAAVKLAQDSGKSNIYSELSQEVELLKSEYKKKERILKDKINALI